MSVKSPGGPLSSGTFTPTVVGSGTAGVGTYTSQEGFYTRIGDRVFYQLRVIWSATTGTGNLRIGGLPFTSGPTGNTSAQALQYNGAEAVDSYMAAISANAAFIAINTHVSGVGLAALALPATGDMLLSGSYILT